MYARPQRFNRSIDLYRVTGDHADPRCPYATHLAYKYYLYLRKYYLCRKLARGNENQLVFVPAIRNNSIKNLPMSSFSIYVTG